MQNVGRDDFERNRRADQLGCCRGFASTSHDRAVGERDAVALQRLIECVGSEVARRGRGRRWGQPTTARGVEPERVHGAQRRLEALHEREARLRLRLHRLGRHLIAHATEAEDRLVGPLE